MVYNEIDILYIRRYFMIYYALLAVSIILTVSKSSLYNSYAKREKPTLFKTFKFNALSYATSSVVALIAILFATPSFSAPTVICALLYAVIVFSLQTISISAMKLGAMVTTSIAVMYGMIIPSVAGPLFFEEEFGLLQGVGISLMLVSLWLLRDKSSNEKKPSNKKWLILAAVAFLLSGMAGLMEKIHQETDGKEEKASFVLIACLGMLLFSVIMAFCFKKKEKLDVIRPSLLLPAIVSGVVIGLYSIVNLTLAGKLNTMIYYPVANGGAMLLTVIVSFLLFGEPLDRRKITGIVLGLSGIVCLSLPIY